MSKIFGGSKKETEFIEPAAVAAPAAAAAPVAAPITEVDSGGASADDSADTLRKKYRPSRSGIGSTGTGLSV